MISETFAPKFLATINDMHRNPVHLLFNQWWSHAPAEVIDDYCAVVATEPGFAAFVNDAHFADPVDLDALASLATGTLGRCYHDWIIANDLTAQIATDYRGLHQAMVDGGQLDNMPPELQYAVLRGFQLHDFLHVLTGYDPSPQGEIALQAFSLAQLQFPYFAMWMSTATTQMTYLRPRTIVALMDAISQGWAYGRATRQISLHRWETELDRPLTEIRSEWGIDPDHHITHPHRWQPTPTSEPAAAS